MDHPSWDPLCDLVLGWHERVGGRRCVAVGGGVASGKSSVARRLRTRSISAVAVVAADDFLRSNAELKRRGWAADKGRPHTYDVEALTDAVRRLMSGETAEVPVYSHRVYDVVEGESRRVEPAPMVLVEGLHVLAGATLDAHVDLRVFLDTPNEVAHRRYLDRIESLVATAGDDPGCFYAWAVDLDPGTVRSIVDALWNDLNLAILEEDVAPSAARADVVVSIGGDERMTLEIAGSLPSSVRALRGDG